MLRTQEVNRRPSVDDQGGPLLVLVSSVLYRSETIGDYCRKACHSAEAWHIGSGASLFFLLLSWPGGGRDTPEERSGPGMPPDQLCADARSKLWTDQCNRRRYCKWGLSRGSQLDRFRMKRFLGLEKRPKLCKLLLNQTES
ncbi:hypothetical protein XENOCAPTIV_011019 [Xenoophorus captivus]|uniref:Uncharacterized protein n=1 Tax=Xenoophorus captivus TaxID=1517983 RepID=A0ABV0Q9B2_9TELE